MMLQTIIRKDVGHDAEDLRTAPLPSSHLSYAEIRPAWPGMTPAPSRPNDPGGVVTGPGRQPVIADRGWAGIIS